MSSVRAALRRRRVPFRFAAQFFEKTHLLRIDQTLDRALERMHPLPKPRTLDERDENQHESKKRASKLRSNNNLLIAVEVVPKEFDVCEGIGQNLAPSDLSMLNARCGIDKMRSRLE